MAENNSRYAIDAYAMLAYIRSIETAADIAAIKGTGTMHIFTEEQARALAATDKAYSARKVSGHWVVWCGESDHVVEFDAAPRIRLPVMAYGVAVTAIRRGKVYDTKLVCSPDNGAWHNVSFGNEDYARKLCDSMRRCEDKYRVPNQAIAYTVVPLPVTG